ncbi:unnamed protein product [Urochloa humidicola]
MAPGPGLLGPGPVGLGRMLSTALSAGGGGGGCKRPRWGFVRPRGGGSSADDRWDLHKRNSVAVVSTNNGKMGAASDKIGKRSESTNNGKMGAASDKIGKRSESTSGGGGGCKRPRWGFVRPRGGGSSADDRWDLHKRNSVAVVNTNNGKMGAASDKIGKRSESTNNGKMGAASDKIGKRSESTNNGKMGAVSDKIGKRSDKEEEGEEIVYVGRMKVR